jgi:hypothetical protein
MDNGGLLPADVTTRPDANDDAPPAGSEKLKELLPTEFVFSRDTLVMAFDLAAGTERRLFDGKRLLGFDLSPDRQRLLTMPDVRGGMARPIWSVGVDGKDQQTLYDPKTSDTSMLEFQTYAPAWSRDGSRVSFLFNTRIIPTGGPASSKSRPRYIDLVTRAEGQADCDAVGKARFHPTDPNVLLIFLTRPCGTSGPGLTEFSVSPGFLPTRTLVPATEFNQRPGFDWLHDGSGIVFVANGDMVRLDLATMTKRTLYNPGQAAFIESFAVSASDEIIVTLATKGDASNPPRDLYRIELETGMATQLTTDGKSSDPSW